MIKAMNRKLSLSFFVLGCAATIGQVLSVRELLVIFYGNELSTAIILGSWLLWTFVGSWIFGKYDDIAKEKTKLFGLLQIILAAFMMGSLILIRLSKLLWRIPAGEITGLGKMIGISFTVLGPFCMISGFLFALGCALYGEVLGLWKKAAGRAYTLEAMGSMAGGLLFTFLIAREVTHMEFAGILAAVLIFSGILFLKPKGVVFALSVGMLALWLVFVFGSESLDRLTRQWQWKGYDLLAHKETPHGVVTVTAADGEYSFFQNGLWMFTCPDKRSAEESVHFALLQHPNPRRILLIGGGMCGSLAEVLKHPSVEFLDYIELDPKLIEMVWNVIETDVQMQYHKIRLIHGDGRNYVRNAKIFYDVIIVNTPDPLTAQLNRFYTLEFMMETRRILNPNGIFSLRLTSSESIIGPTLASYLASIYNTMKQAFKNVVVFPRNSARFFGCNETGVLTSNITDLLYRMEERNLDLGYVREYFLLFDLAPERLSYVTGTLQSAYGPKINTDLTPSCYFYDFVHWSAQHEPFFRDLFLKAAKWPIPWIILASAILLALIVVSRAKGKGPHSGGPVLYACVISGYSHILVTVVLLIFFQIVVGYLYSRLALIIALYMVGLALGSLYITSRMDYMRDPLMAMVCIQGTLIFFPAALLLAFFCVQMMCVLQTWKWLEETSFFFLACALGTLGGAHFSVANALYLEATGKVGRAASAIYGLDLAGSAAGALVAGVLIIPVGGIPQTLLLTSALNLVATMLLVWVWFRKRTIRDQGYKP